MKNNDYTVNFTNNTGYLKVTHLNDETKPCYSVQHFLNPDTPGEIQVTFCDTDEELQKLLYKMRNKYDRSSITKKTNKSITQKVSYDQLVLEITRRCNMHCEHCLRGDAQNKDMPFEIAKQALDSAKQIRTLTLTGGEPTLNIILMEQILEYAKQIQLPITNFYIVTNGKDVSDRFMHILLEYWLYTQQFYNGEEYPGVALSIDKYHETIPAENALKLRAFSFYSDDKDETKYKDRNLINMGRAKNLDAKKHNMHLNSNLEHYVYDGEIYLPENTYITIDGDILSNCDLSYDLMHQYAYGNIMEYDKFINKIIKEEEIDNE